MPITTADFPALTDDLQSIFNEQAKNRLADSVAVKYFSMKDEQRKTHDHQVLHGVSGIQKVTPGSDLPTVNSEQGDSITWTQYYYGALVSITKEMRLFDLYDEIESVARSITDDAFDKVEQSAADMLLNGWATSYTDVYGQTIDAVTPGGLALFSASHTTPLSSATFSNIINDGSNNNPTLSRAAIVRARAVARRYTDPNGIHRPIRLNTLIVGPGQEDLAYRLVKSDLIPQSMNNDTNENIRSIDIQVWDWLDSNSAGTDTSAYWFMVDSSKVKECLNMKFAQRPKLEAPEEVYKNKNWDYSLDYFYSRGLGFPAYIFGSKGTNS